MPVFSRIGVMWLILLVPLLLYAHPGGLDANGGHVNRATGEYHCHRPDCILPHIANPSAGFLNIVSFNIQFLGNYKHRDDAALVA